MWGGELISRVNLCALARAVRAGSAGPAPANVPASCARPLSGTGRSAEMLRQGRDAEVIFSVIKSNLPLVFFLLRCFLHPEKRRVIILSTY